MYRNSGNLGSVYVVVIMIGIFYQPQKFCSVWSNPDWTFNDVMEGNKLHWLHVVRIQ